MQVIARNLIMGCVMAISSNALAGNVMPITPEEAEKLSLVVQINMISPPALSETQGPINDPDMVWTYYVVARNDLKTILGKNYKKRIRGDARLQGGYHGRGWEKGYQWGWDADSKSKTPQDLLILPEALDALKTSEQK